MDVTLARLVGLKASRADLHGAQAARERWRPWWSPSGVAERDRLASLVSPGMVLRLEMVQSSGGENLCLGLCLCLWTWTRTQALRSWMGPCAPELPSVDGAGLALWQPMDGLTASRWM